MLLWFIVVYYSYPLVNIQKAMEAMAHRNRWFTVLKNGGSFYSYVSHCQRVRFICDFEGSCVNQIYDGPH